MLDEKENMDPSANKKRKTTTTEHLSSTAVGGENEGFSTIKIDAEISVTVATSSFKTGSGQDSARTLRTTGNGNSFVIHVR